jgi:hypothetical protein
MARDVFISYRHEDSDPAHRICAMLEREGISCWIAPRDVPPGQQWPTAIAEGIHRSHNLVLVLSSHSRNSKQIAREVEIADRNGLSILTFRLENTDPPPSLEYFLTNLQWIDGFKEKFESAVDQLAEAVRTGENFPAARTTFRTTRPGFVTVTPAPARSFIEPVPVPQHEATQLQPKILSAPAAIASRSSSRSTRIVLASFVLITGLGGITYFLSSPLSRAVMLPRHKAVSLSKYTDKTTAGLLPSGAAEKHGPPLPTNAHVNTGIDSRTTEVDLNLGRAHSFRPAVLVTREAPLGKQTRPPSPAAQPVKNALVEKAELVTPAAIPTRQEPEESIQAPRPRPAVPGQMVEPSVMIPVPETSTSVPPQPARKLPPSDGTSQATLQALVEDWLHRMSAGELDPMMKRLQPKMVENFGTVQQRRFQGCEEDGKGGYNCRFSASSDKFPSLMETLHVGHGVVAQWQVNGYNARTL